MPEPDLTPCFIAREPGCGCATRIVVDVPDHQRSTFSLVAAWVRQGCVIERLTVEDARPLLQRCEHKAAKERANA